MNEDSDDKLRKLVDEEEKFKHGKPVFVGLAPDDKEVTRKLDEFEVNIFISILLKEGKKIMIKASVFENLPIDMRDKLLKLTIKILKEHKKRRLKEKKDKEEDR